MSPRVALIALCFLASTGSRALATTAPPPEIFQGLPSPQALAAAAAIEQSLHAATLFNITANYLNTTGLSLGLTGTTLTFLAPSDDAWHNVTKQPRGAELMKALKGPDAELVLINVLYYHLITAHITSLGFLVSFLAVSNGLVADYDAE